MEKKRLGRGLDALLGGDGDQSAQVPASTLPIASIQTNPNQPRRHFDENALKELTASVQNHGILQPLVVRPVGEGYQLIAGERRLRAAAAAGLTEVPVHIVNLNDQEVLEAALVENIQRSDLNPIEKALGFQEHLSKYNLTQESLADRLGISRSAVSNLIGLLKLHPAVQEKLKSGEISEGHAKILKGVDDPERQVALMRTIIFKNLSVKAFDAYLKEEKAATSAAIPEKETNEPAKPTKSNHVQSIEDELRQKLSVKLEIKLKGKEAGQIVLNFANNDDFERIVESLRT